MVAITFKAHTVRWLAHRVGLVGRRLPQTTSEERVERPSTGPGPDGAPDLARARAVGAADGARDGLAMGLGTGPGMGRPRGENRRRSCVDRCGPWHVAIGQRCDRRALPGGGGGPASVREAKTPPETGHSRPTWPLRPGVLGSPQPGGAGAGQWAPFRGRFCFRLPIYWVGRRRRTGSKVCWARPGRKPYPRPRAGGCVPGRSRAELSRPPYRPEGSRKLRRSGPQTPTIRLQSDSPITRRH